MDLDTESAELNSSALGCKVGNDTALVRYNFGTGSKIIVPMQDFGVEQQAPSAFSFLLLGAESVLRLP